MCARLYPFFQQLWFEYTRIRELQRASRVVDTDGAPNQRVEEERERAYERRYRRDDAAVQNKHTELYERLGLGTEATLEEIQSKFRGLALKW